ncbi:hypothetical protein GMB49_05500, partial [Turicibacter sanguinis]|nr:hypothetical protein [Turicibacter sanguinis]MTO45903.1 hypothetical protein [Turicibacter sanguinis]
MEKKYVEVIKQLMPEDNSNTKIKRAFKNFFSKQEIKSAKIVYLISIPLTLFISFSPDTVMLIKNFSNLSLTLLITIFPGLLTFYTIIISIIGKKNIETLIRAQGQKKTLLVTVMNYYEEILMLYFVGIFITLVVYCYIDLIPSNFTLTKNYVLNCLLAFILIYVYITFVFRLIYELKSTIYNT